MTFEQEITAIDNLAKSCRDRAQANDLLEQEVSLLKEENTQLRTTLEHRTEELDKTSSRLIDLDHQHITEVRANGELKATLKQLLAEQMALASRAGEMLRSLEEPARTMLPDEPSEAIKIEQPTSFRLDKEHKLLTSLIRKTLLDIGGVPIGQTFTLDAPYGEDISDWILKRWYRRILGKPPNNFRDAPSIELRKEEGGRWTFLKQVPKLINSNTEDREPIPFRTEETSTQGNGKPSDPFADNGEDVPSFLKQGPRDDNQGRKASDL